MYFDREVAKNTLNAFKERLHFLLSKISRDGDKVRFYNEVEEDPKLSRIENDLLKLRLNQAKNLKKQH